MRTIRPLAGATLAVLLAAACDRGALETRGDESSITPGDRPSLSVGTMTQVKIVCPGKIQDGAHGYCWAYGVDANGFYTSDYGGTFSTSTAALIAMTSTGNFVAKDPGTAVVNVNLNGVTGTLNVPIYNGVDPTVSMSGINLAKPNQVCSYTATVSGGDAPYTYAWTATSPATGSASGNTWTGSSSGNYTLSVTVGDASGRTATASRNIVVLSGAPDC